MTIVKLTYITLNVIPLKSQQFREIFLKSTNKRSLRMDVKWGLVYRPSCKVQRQMKRTWMNENVNLFSFHRKMLLQEEFSTCIEKSWGQTLVAFPHSAALLLSQQRWRHTENQGLIIVASTPVVSHRYGILGPIRLSCDSCKRRTQRVFSTDLFDC